MAEPISIYFGILIITDPQRSYYRIEEIGTTILSTSHCEFYGARCATTHDELFFPAQFTRLLEN